MSEHFDVIVIGAGPAGSCAAHYLAGAGLRTLLLDRFDFPRDKTCGDGLPPRAITSLAQLGLLEELGRLGCSASSFLIASPGGRQLTVAVPPDSGLPPYTLVVPRYVLDQLILQRALDSGAIFRGGLTVEHVEQSERGVQVLASSEKRQIRLAASAVVLASGANLALARRLGLLSQAPAVMLAARAYYEQIAEPDDQVHFRFDCLPLPSYGWIFPLPGSSANVGAGFLPDPRRRGSMPSSARQAFERFVESPQISSVLGGARRIGPVKGHPLRIDFLSARTYGPRLLAAGEAAGLVNPLTGDGIDYALESGQLAAEQILQMFKRGDFSLSLMQEYDRLLRRRYAALFRWSERLRWLLSRPELFDRLAGRIAGNQELQHEIAGLVLRARQPTSSALVRLLLAALRRS